MKEIVIFFLLTTSIYGENQKVDLPLGYFTSTSENSVMEVYCRQAWEGNNLRTDSIDCDCNQIIISLPDTIEIYKETKEIDSIAKANPEEIKKQVDSFCSSIKNGNNLKYPHLWQIKLQKKLMDMCNDPNCRKNPTTILKAVDMSKSTAKLKINSFRKSFKANGNGKWVSYETNTGLCGLDMVITIEKVSTYQWKYTQIRTSVADTSLLCNGLKESLNKPVIFTQEKERTFQIQGCDYIEVSP